MTITDKIKELITTHRLTPSHFADEIGVQRSIISHILSGRNRPSLDIVQRIVSRFPEVTYEWLLADDDVVGPENLKIPITTIPTVPGKNAPITHSRSKLKVRQVEEFRDSSMSSESGREADDTMPVAKRVIEKILIFYSDNTYTEYSPASG